MSFTSLKESRSIIMRQPVACEHTRDSSAPVAALLRRPVSISVDASFLRLCISWLFDMMLPIRLMSTSGLKGFLIKSDTPTSNPRVSVSASSSAVRKMTGVFITPLLTSISRNLSSVSKPSISGILMSRRTRSGIPLLSIYSRKDLPDFRAVTRKLFLLKM